MDAVDATVTRIMREYAFPGAAVAYGRAGETPTIKAYGNLAATQLLPIASLSKPITAEAIFTLQDAGKLNLDDKLADFAPEVAAAFDQRYLAITVRHLLQHSAGWDRMASFDPLSFGVAARQGLAADPVNCETIAQAMLSRPLDFTPGERGAYSNLGYCWLGIIIERITRQSYHDYVQAAVLSSHGIANMAWAEDPARQYGSAGGWSASAVDMFRFFSSPLRREAAEHLIAVAPHMPSYGLGWIIEQTPQGINHGHWGTLSHPVNVLHIAVHTHDGYVVVAMFNRHPPDYRQAYKRIQDALIATVRR